MIRVFEGFAGYGGGSFGLKRLKENIPDIDYEVVGYSEFDKFAASLYDANHMQNLHFSRKKVQVCRDFAYLSCNFAENSNSHSYI